MAIGGHDLQRLLDAAITRRAVPAQAAPTEDLPGVGGIDAQRLAAGVGGPVAGPPVTQADIWPDGMGGQAPNSTSVPIPEEVRRHMADQLMQTPQGKVIPKGAPQPQMSDDAAIRQYGPALWARIQRMKMSEQAKRNLYEVQKQLLKTPSTRRIVLGE